MTRLIAGLAMGLGASPDPGPPRSAGAVPARVPAATRPLAPSAARDTRAKVSRKGGKPPDLLPGSWGAVGTAHRSASPARCGAGRGKRPARGHRVEGPSANANGSIGDEVVGLDFRFPVVLSVGFSLPLPREAAGAGGLRAAASGLRGANLQPGR